MTVPSTLKILLGIAFPLKKFREDSCVHFSFAFWDSLNNSEYSSKKRLNYLVGKYLFTCIIKSASMNLNIAHPAALYKTGPSHSLSMFAPAIWHVSINKLVHIYVALKTIWLPLIQHHFKRRLVQTTQENMKTIPCQSSSKCLSNIYTGFMPFEPETKHQYGSMGLPRKSNITWNQKPNIVHFC